MLAEKSVVTCESVWKLYSTESGYIMCIYKRNKVVGGF